MIWRVAQRIVKKADMDVVQMDLLKQEDRMQRDVL